MRLALIVSVLALAACQSMMDDDPGPAPIIANEECGADVLQSFVGGPVATAQQAAGQSITRVYAEGDPVTLELLPERINLVTDGQGTLIRVGCG